MKEKRARHVINLISGTFLCFALTTTALFAQATSEADAGQKRLKRARALIAAHRLGAAAAELDAIRTATTDDAVRDVARIMLMSIYLEEGDYMRAQTLLEDTYRLRQAENENSTRTYFALAGQAVNGAREHLARYRSFGINLNDKELPQEANNDLDHMRMLLERVAAQAKEICGHSEKSYDALGLLEEVATVRGTLARTKQERLEWQREIADTRRKLAAFDMRPASAGNIPASAVAMNSQSPAAGSNAASNPAASPNHSTDTSLRAAAPPIIVPTPQARTTPAGTLPEAPERERVVSPAPSSEQPVEVGSLIEKAAQRVNPSYPQTAKMARITGVVKVYLEIDETGAVKSVRSADGPQMLRQAASDAARRWKFRPTIVGGQPVRVVGYINFNFTL